MEKDYAEKGQKLYLILPRKILLIQEMKFYTTIEHS